jgi:hypothetical protein
MGFLAGKRILITGLLSNRSISYGVAKAMQREGAELAFTYQNDRFEERVTKMAAEFGSHWSFPAMCSTTRKSPPCSTSWASTGTAWTGWCIPSPLRPAKPSRGFPRGRVP